MYFLHRRLLSIEFQVGPFFLRDTSFLASLVDAIKL